MMHNIANVTVLFVPPATMAFLAQAATPKTAYDWISTGGVVMLLLIIGGLMLNQGLYPGKTVAKMIEDRDSQHQREVVTKNEVITELRAAVERLDRRVEQSQEEKHELHEIVAKQTEQGTLAMKEFSQATKESTQAVREVTELWRRNLERGGG